MLSADKPIKTPDEDLLARAPLAARLARLMLAVNDNARGGEKPCIVYAVNAPWGAGKSSFLGLLEHELRRCRPDTTPTIIRFNPWQFSSTPQLITMFFHELAAGLNSLGLTAQIISKQLGHLLSALAPLLNMADPSTVGSKAVGGLGKLLAEATPLDKQRALLDDKFQELSARTIIIIDDIDRLEAANIRVLFQMVRLLADFKNVSYVLAFDHEVVSACLDTAEIDGADYLEKIIQVPIDLPAPERRVRRRLLRESLEVTFELSPRALEPEEREFLSRLLHAEAFLSLFPTLRSIKRLANSLEMFLPMVAGDHNLIDFTVIEAIRLWNRPAYTFLSSARHALESIDNHDSKVAFKATLQRAFPDDDVSDILHALLLLCIPDLVMGSGDKVESGEEMGPNERDSASKRRLRHRRYYQRYFLLGVGVSDVSADELDRWTKQPGEGAEDVLASEEVAREAYRALMDDRCASFFLGLGRRAPWMEEERLSKLIEYLILFELDRPIDHAVDARVHEEGVFYGAHMLSKLLCHDKDPRERLERALSQQRANLLTLGYIIRAFCDEPPGEVAIDHQPLVEKWIDWIIDPCSRENACWEKDMASTLVLLADLMSARDEDADRVRQAMVDRVEKVHLMAWLEAGGEKKGLEMAEHIEVFFSREKVRELLGPGERQGFESTSEARIAFALLASDIFHHIGEDKAALGGMMSGFGTDGPFARKTILEYLEGKGWSRSLLALACREGGDESGRKLGESLGLFDDPGRTP